MEVGGESTHVEQSRPARAGVRRLHHRAAHDGEALAGRQANDLLRSVERSGSTKASPVRPAVGRDGETLARGQ